MEAIITINKGVSKERATKLMRMLTHKLGCRVSLSLRHNRPHHIWLSDIKDKGDSIAKHFIDNNLPFSLSYRTKGDQ